MLSKLSLDQAEAARISLVCVGEAIRRNVAISVAVVDDAGVLLHFLRMDRARPHTVELAMRKARSAAASGVNTRLIEAALKAGIIGNVDSVGLGGAPFPTNAGCAGAVGVSGASPEVDDEIAAMATDLLPEPNAR